MPSKATSANMLKLEQWQNDIKKITSGKHFPHANNLLRKLSLPKATTAAWIEAFEQIVPEYIKFRQTSIKRHGEKTDYSLLVSNVNAYLNLLKDPKCDIFSRQSDFRSSVIPEFMYILFDNIVSLLGASCIVNAQDNVIVDCQFDASDNGRIIFKKKRVDAGIFLPGELSFNGEIRKDFSIPLVVTEVKTNLDKNMISGIEHSVESLKRTFPKCLYIAITEFADFAVESQNYATTAIDEIFVLRKQKRSEVRPRTNKGERLGGLAKDVNIELVDELGGLVQSHLQEAFKSIPSVKERMVKGRLIKID